MASKRDTDSSSAPSAKFLQARVTALSTSCIKRLENIFAAALNEDHSTYQAPPNSNDDTSNPPPLTETAVKQLQLDVESSALIRAAEDFMVLTRTMKELWLFGDLDTIHDPRSQDTMIKKQMQEDEQLVVQNFLDLMKKVGENNQQNDLTDGGSEDQSGR